MSSRSMDLFFRACEVVGTPSLSLGSEPNPRVMDAPFAVAGSDPGCDLVIADPAVSPRHCYLQAIGSKVLCIDLGSENGVSNADGPAVASWIDPYHVVRLGRQVLRLVGGSWGPDESDVPEDRDEDGPLLARPLPRIALEFQTNTVKTRWRMRRAVALVGTSPSCAVRLNGPSVSRYHCALVRTGQGLWVVDLLGQVEPAGRPGIAVNGEPVRFARIDPGDVLRVGSFCVTLRYLPAPARKSPTSARGRADDDASGSGEIEVVGKDRAEPDERDFDAEVAAIRRDFEGRFAAQAAQHRDEVESLRGEIDELNDLIVELRSAAPPRRPSGPRRGPSLPLPAPAATWPRKSSVRTLGTARRRPHAIPAGYTLGAPMDRSDLPSVDGVPC